MFSVIVLIHEYGHYKTARFFGVKVEEFWLWIPPRAKKLWKNKEGTLFSLNWIPLGGFVKISGESEVFLDYFSKKWKKLSLKWLEKKIKNSQDIFDKNQKKISQQELRYIKAYIKNSKTGGNFYEKHIWAKTLILIAGVVMNFILAGIIFSLLFFIWVKPIGINTFIETDLPSKIIPSYQQAIEEKFLIKEQGIVLYPIAGSPAEKAGIKQWYILENINGVIPSDIMQLQKYIKQRAGETIKISLLKWPNTYTSNNIEGDYQYAWEVEIQVNDDGTIGSYLSENIIFNEDFLYKYSFLESIKYWFLETYYQTRLTFSGLKILFKNIFIPETPQDRQDAIEQVAWPIGIVNIITQSITGWVSLLLILWAIISVNLGVFNLLPIPALDWGRILLLWIRSAIDMLFWKSSLSANIENFIHVIFFLLLIVLSILIAYNDIGNLLGK